MAYDEAMMDKAAYHPGTFGPMTPTDMSPGLIVGGADVEPNSIAAIRKTTVMLHERAMTRAAELDKAIAGHKAAIEQATAELHELRALAETIRPHLVNDPGNLR